MTLHNCMTIFPDDDFSLALLSIHFYIFPLFCCYCCCCSAIGRAASAILWAVSLFIIVTILLLSALRWLCCSPPTTWKNFILFNWMLFGIIIWMVLVFFSLSALMFFYNSLNKYLNNNKGWNEAVLKIEKWFSIKSNHYCDWDSWIIEWEWMENVSIYPHVSSLARRRNYIQYFLGISEMSYVFRQRTQWVDRVQLTYSSIWNNLRSEKNCG